MNMIKTQDGGHTAGPWKYTNRVIVNGSDKYDSTVCSLYNCNGNSFKSHSETAANARLISASPDGYIAAKEALSALFGAKEITGDICNVTHAINLLEAYLDKAQGGKL